MGAGQSAAKEKPPAAAQPVEQQPLYQPISRPAAAYPMHAGVQVPYGQPVMMQPQPIPNYQQPMMGYPGQGHPYNMAQHALPQPMHQQPMHQQPISRQPHVAPPVSEKAPAVEPVPVKEKE